MALENNNWEKLQKTPTFPQILSQKSKEIMETIRHWKNEWLVPLRNTRDLINEWQSKFVFYHVDNFQVDDDLVCEVLNTLFWNYSPKFWESVNDKEMSTALLSLSRFIKNCPKKWGKLWNKVALRLHEKWFIDEFKNNIQCFSWLWYDVAEKLAHELWWYEFIKWNKQVFSLIDADFETLRDISEQIELELLARDSNWWFDDDREVRVFEQNDPLRWKKKTQHKGGLFDPEDEN